MKKLIFGIIVFFLLVSFTFSIYAKTVRVRGGTTKYGTYRQPHFRTSPNRTKFDNWSTRGNINPYTGRKGSADPFKPKLPKLK